MKTVYCIGELLIDFVAEKQGSNLSKAIDFTKKAGGAPANVACAIAKLGGNSSFIGTVGKDPFGTFLLDVLKDNGVNISFAQRTETFTTLAFVSLAEDGERDFVFSQGADQELDYDSKIGSLYKNNLVHFGAATAMLGGSLEETYRRYFDDAIAQNAFISFDPNFRIDLWKGNETTFIEKCIPFIEKSNLCKFSSEEAQLISGKSNLEDCCDYFHEMGVQVITITLGGEGTLLSTVSSKQTIGSIDVRPVDTTGAGDAFIGCLLRQVSTLENPHDIVKNLDQMIDFVKIANKAGAITTTGFGAIPSLPNYKEIFD
ncbi:carbohydrate kinase [Maribacter algicola]|uniref:Carbohydrate kinase n=1 Tax=Meishania litoralis TaxID=3434685 RepID=A0ACC7LJ14_9FLAO